RSRSRVANSSTWPGRMMNPLAVSPCLVAFWEDAALPSGVRGPVECWALARLASICAEDDIWVSAPFECSHSVIALDTDEWLAPAIARGGFAALSRGLS